MSDLKSRLLRLRFSRKLFFVISKNSIAYLLIHFYYFISNEKILIDMLRVSKKEKLVEKNMLIIIVRKDTTVIQDLMYDTNYFTIRLQNNQH